MPADPMSWMPTADTLQGVLQTAGAEAVAVLCRERSTTDARTGVTIAAMTGNTAWLHRPHLRWLERLAYFTCLRGQILFTDSVGTGVDEPAPAGVRTAWFVPLPRGRNAAIIVVFLNPLPGQTPEKVLAELEALTTRATERPEREELQASRDSPASGPVNRSSISLTSEAEAIQRRERKRLSYDLHDGPARRLVECLHRIENCEKLIETEQSAARAELRATQLALHRALDEMRRLVHRYRSGITDADPQARLLAMIEDFQNLSSAEVTVDCPSTPPALEPDQLEALYSLVEEALFNAWRHGNPTSVSVQIRTYGPEVRVMVVDNGRGFDPVLLRQSGQEGSSVGLLGIAERIEGCGGTLQIDSTPGHGVTVMARFPLDAPLSAGITTPLSAGMAAPLSA